MGEIFRELQEESKERETRGAFERWLTEKRGTPLLLEQTQAYEAFKAGMKHYGCMTAVRMFQAEEAALAQPETEAEPVMWMNRYDATMKTRDRVTANAMGFTIPLYAHPPRDEWRSAVHEELFTSCIYSAKHARDPRAAIRDIIDWNVRIALDPAVSSDAQALIDKGRAMRDEWRPASEPPDSDRLVIVWVADARSPSNGGYFCTDSLRPSRANPDARIWASIGVTHWRDVQPPTEGE